jgi:hypothetical protein
LKSIFKYEPPYFDGVDIELLDLIIFAQFFSSQSSNYEITEMCCHHKYLVHAVLKDFTQRERLTLNYGGGLENGHSKLVISKRKKLNILNYFDSSIICF